jgi:predicted metalloendopeptidase
LLEENALRVRFTSALSRPFASTAICQSSNLKGIGVADLDKKVDPCADFFEYSNGTWRAESYSKVDGSLEPVMEGRRDEQGPAEGYPRHLCHEAPKGTPAQLTGDFYAACTNEKAIDAAGTSFRCSRC